MINKQFSIDVEFHLKRKLGSSKVGHFKCSHRYLRKEKTLWNNYDPDLAEAQDLLSIIPNFKCLTMFFELLLQLKDLNQLSYLNNEKCQLVLLQSSVALLLKQKRFSKVATNLLKHTLGRKFPIELFFDSTLAPSKSLENEKLNTFDWGVGEYLRETKHKNFRIIDGPDIFNQFLNSTNLYDLISHASLSNFSVFDTKVDSPMDIVTSINLSEGLKTGKYFKGLLLVYPHSPQNGEVTLFQCNLSQKMLVIGSHNMNRCFDGDEVVVEFFEKDMWSPDYYDNFLTQIDPTIEDEVLVFQTVKLVGGQTLSQRKKTTPTGKIVGTVNSILLIERDPVLAYVPLSSQSESTKSEFVLVVPVNRKLPKIRIQTKHIGNLQGQNIIARYDNWPNDSMFPNGHMVQVLGTL